ncbi:TPA: LPXTG cell wall anchor domain-containing protein [Streptococcus suis 2524]|uniref:M14 family metallopeptidase n=1 Tax=Streptococcus suis TaxID=1307 RepID=UPI0004159FBE|nr:M14 family zinc carboxypeptidase [Streptococcus suis]HEM3217829.1 LPXTG cell wall anchor domain-containing protein [Streptococcus suis 2524]HEM4181115.1 LPXTG cell wall anchor domain-containing protein [Streptococcus suis]
MKLSYKKRLLNQVLLASTVLLAASLAQGTVFANTEEIPPTTNETVTPLPEETPITKTSTSEATDNLVEGKETEKQTEEIADTSPTPVSTEEDTTSSEPNAEETTLRSANNDNQDTTEEKSAVPTIDTVTLETKTVYLSEAVTITESITLPDTTEKIEWTLDGKPISEWKTWNLKEGDFTGDTFITVEESRQDNQLHLNIQLAALFGEDLSKRTPSNIRRTYRHFIKDMLLEGTSADGNLIISKTLHFRPYEAYRTHEEMLTEIEETKNNAATDRLVRIESIGQSAEGRDIKMAVVAKDQASIDKYLTETTPLMLTQPDQMLKQLQAGTFDYKLPILINNTHADEQPGIDVVTSLFKEFAQKDTITFPSTDADGNPVTLHLKVTDLLDKFIFLFNFTENPDGDVKNLRSLVNGLDPNRDTGFQVNPETQAIVRQIHKWNPISVLDIHGFVSGFLIEPATPPHDPNFEYDLLADIMLEKAHEMGRAGIANSKYERYTIPKVHWGDGWDDSFSGYTAVYAMYHGILGHTIEIPEGNQESFKAGFFAVLGGIYNMATKPDSLMEMRLKYYSRGVNKVEDPKAESELVGPDGAVVGRVKKDQPKFFPDYYVIPMTLDKHNDMQEAFKMIEYFNRNGVVVKELTEDVGNFRKGDLVVDMAQAKRGFANHVLYAGSDESAWGAMYAELVVNFPDMKGFSAKAVFEENAFSGKLGSITWTKAPRTTEIDFKAPYYVVANTSESAVQAINQAIKSGAKVYLTDDGYIMETNQFSHLLDTYALYGEPLYKKPLGQELKAMKVYAPSHSYSWAGDFAVLANAALTVERMGFEIVNSADEADAIILESDQFDASVFGKKPIIIVGGVAMQKLEELGILAGFNAEQFTEGIPEGFKTLVKIADKDYYIAGWWPGHDKLANKIVAIAGNYQDQPVFIYAGNPTNKVHPVHFFRWVSNALFGSQLASLEDLPAVEILVPQPEMPKNILDEAPKTTTVVHTTKSTDAKQLPQTGEKTNYIAIALGSLLLGSIALRRKERS